MTAGSGGLFPELTLHHVGFSVADLDTAIAFYGEVFGMTLEQRTFVQPLDLQLAFLRRDDVRLEFFQMAGSRPVPEHREQPNTDLTEQGTKHPCFAVGDAQRALEALHARDDTRIVGVIRKSGDPMVEEVDPCLSPNDDRAPATGFFFRDPCGLIVEVVAAGAFPD